jgi:hypothetical protein
MSHQDRLDNNGREATGLTKPDDRDDRVQKKGKNVVHARDGNKLMKLKNSRRFRNSPTTPRGIWREPPDRKSISARYVYGADIDSALRLNQHLLRYRLAAAQDNLGGSFKNEVKQTLFVEHVGNDTANRTSASSAMFTTRDSGTTLLAFCRSKG